MLKFVLFQVPKFQVEVLSNPPYKSKFCQLMLFSEGKDEDQTMIAYKESDVLENLEEDEESGFPQPPKVGCEN